MPHGAIIVSKSQEGNRAANSISKALNEQGDFKDTEVNFGTNVNDNYVIRIRFVLTMNQNMEAPEIKLEEMANKGVVEEANIINYGMIRNHRIKNITVQLVESQELSMSR